MKCLLSITSILIIVIGLSACSHNEKNASVTAAPMKTAPESLALDTVEVNGVVKHLLMNPSGKVDGFILNDGTQIYTPPHLSSQVTKTALINERVNVIGVKDHDRLITATRVMNVYTNKVVEIVAPTPKIANVRAVRTGMQQLQARGKIKSKIFGKEGELKGVILSDSSIVRFGPKVAEKAKFEVGQQIKVSGYGTKNSNGKSLEATSISTY